MQPENVQEAQTFKIWFSTNIINNEVFMFWFNVICIVATITSIICAIISCKITNKTKNLNKYTMYSKAYDFSKSLKESYRVLINHCADPGKNYSDEISNLIEQILNLLPTNEITELTKILNNKFTDYKIFVSSISVTICLKRKKLDSQYYDFSSNISELSNYLKKKKESYEGKLS